MHEKYTSQIGKYKIDIKDQNMTSKNKWTNLKAPYWFEHKICNSQAKYFNHWAIMMYKID